MESYQKRERCTLRRQFQRDVCVSLSFEQDVDLTVRFDASPDWDRIIIDTESILAYRRGDPLNMYHELILEADDILRIESALEGESRSIMAEMAQDAAEAMFDSGDF